MAHVRRRFAEVRDEAPDETSFVLAAIQLRYRIEAELRELPPALRWTERLERSEPIRDVLKKTLEDHPAKVLPKSQFGEANAHP